MNRSSLRKTSARALVLVTIAAVAASSQALVTYKGTDTFNNFVSGVELNSFLGANAFYGHGYTGTRTTVANISAGLAYTNHEMLTKVSKTFAGVGAVTTVSEHETLCTSMIGGYNAARPYDGQVGQNGSSYSTGIAYGANLWSGSIATSIGSGGSFNTSTNSVFTGYYNALAGGIGGSTANIASSSYGQTSTNVDVQRFLASGAVSSTVVINNTTYSVSNYMSVGIDSIVAATNKLIIFSAGNNGGTSGILGTPGAPASGNNALVVGASGPNGAPTNTASFTGRASFSAYGPSSAFIPGADGQTGTIVNEATAQRARVDILAPGQGIVGADSYNDGQGNSYYNGGDGTSFATPIVAGGAALIEDAGQALGYTNSVDNRVVTAILQTSADKLAGWTNNATTSNGVSTTTQALDFQQGAGQMNLTKAYNVLTGGTHDVLGTKGGTVQAKGWDYGSLDLGTSTDYLLTGTPGLAGLAAGSTFTATLRFNGGATFGTLGANNTVSESQLGYTYLSNFSLQLLKVTLGPGGAGIASSVLVAESDAQYITSEHFQYTIGQQGFYALRVNYLNDVYNLGGNHGEIGYGLAWSGTAAVPEPASFAVLGLGAAALLRRRRKA